jgi:hypothetical protein
MELETPTLARAKSAEKENTPKEQYTNERSKMETLAVKYEHLWDFSDQTEQIGFQIRGFLHCRMQNSGAALSPTTNYDL